MFCISMNANHLDFIKQIKYIPVGLGEDTFSNEWYRDNTGNNISKKNKNYGEYTFHYWLWKNYVNNNEFNDKWIGFCQYRKFWSNKKNFSSPATINDLQKLVLSELPEAYQNTDVILGEEIVTTNFKKMKFLKKGLRLILENPSYLFNKKKKKY